jgi:hypothetical protein
MSDDDTLRQAIAEEEARLARIEKERAEVLAKLQELMGRLATEISAPAPATPILPEVLPFPPSIPSTAEEKVALFRSLFRGREDVFPRLWENTRTGRKGYAPACSNEWVSGVCRKPRCQVRKLFA